MIIPIFGAKQYLIFIFVQIKKRNINKDSIMAKITGFRKTFTDVKIEQSVLK